MDILINNAGILFAAPADETTDEMWETTFAVNVTAVFKMARVAIRQMKKQVSGGSIVNTGSESGINGEPQLSAYCASKGSVHQMTKCMALDHVRDGIRVNAICPGETRTKMINDWLERQPGDIEDHIRELGASLPIKRIATPDEVANAALFLASNEASYCVGTMLSVDGGNAATGGPYPV